MTSYDQWDDQEEDRTDKLLDDESKFDAALSRDEVAPGYHIYGPYVIQVLEDGDIDYCSTIVMPARIGWTPKF